MLTLSVLAGACRSEDPVREESFETLIEASNEYYKIREYERATAKALDALALAERAGDDALRARALCVLGELDVMTWRDEQALDHAQAAEDLSRENDLPKTLAQALLIKGRLAIYAGISPETMRDDEALKYIEEALAVAQKAGLTEEQVRCYYSLCDVYVDKNRWEDVIDQDIYAKAGENLKAGEDLAREAGLADWQRKAVNYKLRYLRQGGRIQEAITACEDMLSDCSDDDHAGRAQAFDKLTVLYAQDDRVQESVNAHMQYVTEVELLQRQMADAMLQEMETKYETALKQQKLNRAYLHIQALLLGLLIALAVVLASVNHARKVRRINKELAVANSSKEELLSFISRDLANPTVKTKDAVLKFVKEYGSMSEAQIRESCDALVRDSEDLNKDVAEYVGSLMLKRKKAAEAVGLTSRETEIVRLSSEGLSSAEIAERLHISVRTVNNHKQNIYSKMHVGSNAEMLHMASTLGLI